MVLFSMVIVLTTPSTTANSALRALICSCWARPRSCGGSLCWGTCWLGTPCCGYGLQVAFPVISGAVGSLLQLDVGSSEPFVRQQQ